MMKPLLLAAATALTLAGCVSPAPQGQSSQPQSMPATSPTQVQQFYSAIEARRGSALSMTERAQIQGLTGATKASINAAQNGFLNQVGSHIGMDGALLAALFPEVGRPISESAAVTRIERAAGKPLAEADKAVIRSATALRNNSVQGARNSLASSIGQRTGLTSEAVLALMPLLGL